MPKTKQNPGILFFISQKCRGVISANLFLNLILSTINHKFIKRVFQVKLIHPCCWVHIILIRHYLPVQTITAFRNFFDEDKEIESKLHSIVLLA